MMNKFAIAFLTAAMTLGCTAAIAADSAVASADASTKALDAIQHSQPDGVDNSKINHTADTSTVHKQTKHHKSAKHHKKSSVEHEHQNTHCKDGKCQDVNKKVSEGAESQTPSQ